MSLEQVANSANKAREAFNIDEVIDRADPQEVEALLRRQETAETIIDAERGLDAQTEKSQAIIAERKEVVDFVTNLNNPREARVAKLKEKLWNLTEWASEAADETIAEAQELIKKKKMDFIESKVKEKLWALSFLSPFFLSKENKEKFLGFLDSNTSEWWDVKDQVFWWFMGAIAGWIFWKETVEGYKALSSVEAPELAIWMTDTIPWVPNEPAGWEVPTAIQGQVVWWNDANQEIIGDSDEAAAESLDEEKRVSMYKNWAKIMLLKTSGLDLHGNDIENMVLSKIGTKSYGEIKKDYYDYLFSANANRFEMLLLELWVAGDNVLSENEEKFVNILEALAWTNARTIIESRLNNISTVVSHPSFIEKFPKLHEKIKGQGLESMAYADVLTVLAFKIPVDISKGIANGKMSLQQIYFGASEEVKEFISEVRKDWYKLVSKDLLLAFWRVHNTSFGDSALVRQENNDRYRQEMNYNWSKVDSSWNVQIAQLWVLEREQLDKIIWFKDELIANLKNDPLISRFEDSWTSFASLLDTWVNYSEIVSIYMLLDGKPNIGSLDIVEKLWLYWVVANIVSQGVDGTDQRFLLYIANEASKSLENDEGYFSPEEAYFILSNLNQQSQKILDTLLAGPNIARRLLWERFNDSLPEIGDEEWWLIWIITWGPAFATFVPHIGVKMIAGWISAFGVSMALWKLNENGTLKMIAEEESLSGIKEKIDKGMELVDMGTIDEYRRNNPVPHI